MKSTADIKYWIDVGMGISFLLCFVTGLLKWPTRGAGGLGPRYLVTVVHDFTGLFLGVFVFFHVLLNWEWIVCMTKKKLGLNK